MFEKIVYPEGVVEFILENCKDFTKPELVKLIKEKFDYDITQQQIRYQMKKHNLRSGLDCRFKKGLEPLNKGKRMPQDVYEKVAPTMFKKGTVPPNHKPVGTISEDKDGYLLIKVEEGRPGHIRRCDLWKPLHRIKWQEYHHQEVPPNHAVIFADGNKRNFEEDNLILVSRGELAQLNKNRRMSNEKDVTKANILITKIELKMSDLKKERKEGKDGGS